LSERRLKAAQAKIAKFVYREGRPKYLYGKVEANLYGRSPLFRQNADPERQITIAVLFTAGYVG
jgi:hypothetical protein